METTQSRKLQDFYRYLQAFTKKQKEHAVDRSTCAEDLMADLIKLEDKTKKAFPNGMPLLLDREQVVVSIKDYKD